MHPIFAHRERLWLYMAAWLMLAGLLSLLFLITGTLQLGEAAALLVPMSLLYAFISLSSLYVCRAFPLQQRPFLAVAGSALLAAFLSASVWILLGKGLAMGLAELGHFRDIGTKYNGAVPLFLAAGVLLFVLSVVVHYLLLAFDAARAMERTALELQVLAREAELKALRSQIQPHFLFNSLNSISALTASNPTAARNMALQLAEFFRATLRVGQLHRIPLTDEVALAELFLTIEQVRFGSRLTFRKSIAADCGQLPVPSLILQPLMENAVNHGIAHLIDGGEITLSAERCNGMLLIRIANPFDPGRPRHATPGVGLANTRKRLAALHSDQAHLRVDQQVSLFTVELILPLQGEYA